MLPFSVTGWGHLRNVELCDLMQDRPNEWNHIGDAELCPLVEHGRRMEPARA